MKRPASLRIRNLLLAGLAAAFFLPATGAAETTKHARSNDVASRYILDDSGNLFRTVGKHKCQITNDVESFKVSQHPDDAAVIYFVRNDDLHVLHNADDSGNCPKASKRKILSDVAKEHGEHQYNVVPSSRAEVVAVALDQGGQFIAWDDENVVLRKRSVEDYRLYNKFGKKGEPFRRYAVFAINEEGRVFKVNGTHPKQSDFDPRNYQSLKEFWAKNLSH